MVQKTSRSHAAVIASQVEASGLCVFPNFLSEELLLATQNDFHDVHASGAFHRAGVGQGHAQEVHDRVRRDQVYWLEHSKTTPAQTQLLESLESLKDELNT